MRVRMLTVLCIPALVTVWLALPSGALAMGKKRASEESGRTSSTGIGGAMSRQGKDRAPSPGGKSTMDTNTSPGGSGTGSSTLDRAHDRSTSGAPGGMSGSGAGQR